MTKKSKRFKCEMCGRKSHKAKSFHVYGKSFLRCKKCGGTVKERGNE